MDEAMHHYTRAKSIVDLVAGMSNSDQEEVDKNKVSVLLNIAAVHMEQGEHAAACSSCTAALALDPKNVKGLVRRAQCHIARHEHKVSDSCFSLQDGILTQIILTSLPQPSKVFHASPKKRKALGKGCTGACAILDRGCLLQAMHNVMLAALVESWVG